MPVSFLVFTLFSGQYVIGDDRNSMMREGGQKKQEIVLTFGVYQSDKASVMYNTFMPVVKYLDKELDKLTNQDIGIDITIFKTYHDAILAVRRGKVDFVRFGPASYITTKKFNHGIRILAMELIDGRKNFSGMIVVKNDSSITSLGELKQRSFAFGDKNSTIGRYIAQYELLKAGIREKDLLHHGFLGRHDIVANAVLLGDYDAGSIKENTFNKYNKYNKLRVIKKFSNVTKPWIARDGLAPDLFSAIQQSLLNLQVPDILKKLGVSGFAKSSISDYASVQEAMENAKKFSDER